MFQMLGVFAEFERSMIQERVKAGLERAKIKGVKLGRPRLPGRKRAEILRLHQEGRSQRAIARDVGVALGTVQNVLREWRLRSLLHTCRSVVPRPSGS